MNNVIAPSILKVGECLTIQQVSEYYDNLKNVDFAHDLKINVSEVQNIDTAGLQLLLYIIFSVKNVDGNFNWDPKPSSYFLEQAKLAGMIKELSLIQGELK